MQTTLKLNRNLILPSFHPVIRIKDDGGSLLCLRMLKLRRLNPSIYHHQNRGQNTQHNHYINRVTIFAQTTTSMADTNKEVERREKQPPAPPDTAAEKKKKQLPPPPEKPEAGDCCGSGCVRCVWDIYYDELDAYDELLKEFNQSPDSV